MPLLQLIILSQIALPITTTIIIIFPTQKQIIPLREEEVKTTIEITDMIILIKEIIVIIKIKKAK